jgi:hypothetical protein
MFDYLGALLIMVLITYHGQRLTQAKRLWGKARVASIMLILQTLVTIVGAVYVSMPILLNVDTQGGVGFVLGVTRLTDHQEMLLKLFATLWLGCGVLARVSVKSRKLEQVRSMVA